MPIDATDKGWLVVWLERALVGCLFLLAFAAPHSIAGTQIAWGVGLLIWTVRCAFKPRPRLNRTPVDYLLLGFFVLTFITALTSYDPDVSIGKLRAASLFTIVYLVAENVASRRMLRLLIFTLVASCLVNVVYTFGALAVGRGVKVESLTAESALRAAGVNEGDTLLRVDGARLNSPDELARALRANATGQATARLQVYRLEWIFDADLPRGETTATQLGIAKWTRGRDQRATGFYGHYTTYAEVLQLVGSLAVGLLIALRRRRSWLGALLAAAVAGMSLALLLTVTRASWLAFLISVCVMSCAGFARRGFVSRKALAVVALGALLVIPAGLYVLQQKRQVGFFDRKDGSITWRETVYREGFALFVQRPRHVLVGIGMDSLKRHWREWGMFDHGRLPWGHMHSTPLQLALERGLPVLLVWLALLFVYARMLWRLWRSPALDDWRERGLALGALGGLCGFFTSGLVHYNFGDSEVVMVFYLIMGLALALERFAREEASHEETQPLRARNS